MVLFQRDWLAPREFTRREFFRQGGAAAWLLGLAGTLKSMGASPRENPFAYDVRRLARTDPRLIHYRETSRLACPHEDPSRVAVGPDDELYLAAGHYVTVFHREGHSLRDIALRSPASCLAVTKDNEAFLGLRDHVEVYDAKGQRRAAWESPGPRTWLTGITVTGNHVFLADAGQRVVWRCDRSGKVLGRIGDKDKERNILGFVVPSPFFDLEMHRDGLLRVANPGRHRVEAYTAEGDLEMFWGKPSAAIDAFCGCCNPINIALLPDGRFVTCEKGLPRVKVYSAEGVFESVVAGPESFPENAGVSAAAGLSDCRYGGLDAAVDSVGRIYILDLVKGDIRVMVRQKDASEAGPGQPTPG